MLDIGRNADRITYRRYVLECTPDFFAPADRI